MVTWQNGLFWLVKAKNARDFFMLWATLRPLANSFWLVKIENYWVVYNSEKFRISNFEKKVVKRQLLYKLQIHVSNDTIFISVTILKQVATKKSQQQLYNLSNLMILITIRQFPVADLPFLIAALAHPIHPKLENKNKIPSKKCLPPWKVNQLHLFSESWKKIPLKPSIDETFWNLARNPMPNRNSIPNVGLENQLHAQVHLPSPSEKSHLRWWPDKNQIRIKTTWPRWHHIVHKIPWVHPQEKLRENMIQPSLHEDHQKILKMVILIVQACPEDHHEDRKV